MIPYSIVCIWCSRSFLSEDEEKVVNEYLDHAMCCVRKDPRYATPYTVVRGGAEK